MTLGCYCFHLGSFLFLLLKVDSFVYGTILSPSLKHKILPTIPVTYIYIQVLYSCNHRSFSVFKEHTHTLWKLHTSTTTEVLEGKEIMRLLKKEQRCSCLHIEAGCHHVSPFHFFYKIS